MQVKTRAAFVGVGGIANYHLSRLAEIEGVEIVGLCDLIEERAVSAAEKYGGQVYTDYRRMLDEVEMDALYVCVPPDAHSDAEIRAAQKGVHLFVEKPVVMHLETGLPILEAIDKAGVLSCVGYQFRYMPSTQAVRTFLTGREVAMICANRWGNIPGNENHWWRVFAKSGGQLLEMATHQLDAMRWLAGDVKEVCARYAQRATRDLPNVTVPDVQVAVLEFASGAVGYLSTSCALNQGGGLMDLHVILKDMRLEVGNAVRVVPEGAAEIGPLPEPVPSIDQAFIAAVQTGDRSLIRCDYREGLKSAATCIAANESAATGRPVSCWNG
ncbi:MAG TPA: Gfo/Idh/MocA family oxidoreductase [Chthonomonadaceae bacterium]|nr:Gfo/Idh/MocA family oxidoreductase [Chthonomonadaceae bacterium]